MTIWACDGHAAPRELMQQSPAALLLGQTRNRTAPRAVSLVARGSLRMSNGIASQLLKSKALIVGLRQTLVS